MRIPGIPFVQGRWDYTDYDGKHYGIAIHCTANTASDTAEASFASRRPDGTSFHLVVDHDSVTQSLDLSDRAGHAGSDEGNDHAIAVEIVGLTTWSRAKWLSSVAWPKLGAALAWIIKHDPDYKGFRVRRASVPEMRKNPQVKALYGHNDMRLAWGGTDHTDPGPNFPWDRLIEAINNALGGAGEDDDMALSQEGRAAVRAEVIAALETVRPYQASGPRGRLKDRLLYPPKGWGDVSVRSGLDYLFERTAVAAKEAAEAKLRDAAILAAVQGLDQEAVLARVEELAAREAERAEAQAARDAVRDARDAARHAELLELLDGEGADAGEVVQRVRAVVASWAEPSEDGPSSATAG
jgi:N-acetyl-anhydromuramyl-L-alanine amidase AmpD